MPENIWTVTTTSFDALRKVASAIDDTNGDAATPCSEWNVTQVLQHAIGDQLAWAASLGVGSGPSENPFAPSGRLEGSVGDLVKPALAIADSAWTGVKSDADTVSTPLPQGAFPPNIAAAACALDAAVHAWDIAVALGQPSPLTNQLATDLLPAVRDVVEPLRQYGAYAEALPPIPEDDAVAELLRYLGRDAGWSAGR
ncbi:MAG TPA: TIGR03086 family metal-binding protein [Acidimicrobiales bacterium]|nr:TIGR03086 family metal-binding protein [Acidimicrobiales bacterium]